MAETLASASADGSDNHNMAFQSRIGKDRWNNNSSRGRSQSEERGERNWSQRREEEEEGRKKKVSLKDLMS